MIILSLVIVIKVEKKTPKKEIIKFKESIIKKLPKGRGLPRFRQFFYLGNHFQSLLFHLNILQLFYCQTVFPTLT